MRFDIDATVDAVAGAMAAKHSFGGRERRESMFSVSEVFGRRPRPAGLSFEQSVKAVARDRDVADLIARKRRGPMSFVDDRGGVTVVLPAGVRGG